MVKGADAGLDIEATVAQKITFAGHQCGLPVLSELRVANHGDVPYRGLDLVLEVDPAFMDRKRWHIEQLLPGEQVKVDYRDLQLSGDFLLNIDEAISGNLSVRLLHEQELLTKKSYDICLLARNEWGGSNVMPELLPAYVLPNDPVIDKYIIHPASDILSKAGKSGSMDGYMSRSRTRVWEMASSIWSSAVARRIGYTLPPASFESQGQKIRTPSRILDSGVATCLDFSLLFASAFEQVGLHPVIILFKAHALVGVWLQPPETSSIIVDEASAVRKRVELDELLLFETTLALQHRAIPFSRAIQLAKEKMLESSSDKFTMLVDVHTARSMGYKPISLFTKQHVDTVATCTEQTPPLEDAPELNSFDIEPSTNKADETPETRLDRWQRKLLDLSLRNKLLNYRETKASLKLYCPAPSKLEDKLADGKKLSFVEHLTKTQATLDPDIVYSRTGGQLGKDAAIDALDKNKIYVEISKEDLEARLLALYRKAREGVQQGGANTLYLSLGFLAWKKSERDTKAYRAPLILVPVTLDRTSVRAKIRMQAHDDEPRVNSTLLQMLQQDFRLDIPDLGDNILPSDDHGIDVIQIWNIVRRAIRDLPGFEVVEDTVLSNFTFAKYLMWKDLVDRTSMLKKNAVVRHLIDTPTESYPDESGFIEKSKLDGKYHPNKFYTPLQADSSQLACIEAAMRGKSFVMLGPPGTGKSQTISNMIAHLIGEQKTVLFVSAKKAALDVVHRRLTEEGLGQFCLELHSNKARKADVHKQLRSTWNQQYVDSVPKREVLGEQVKRKRDILNDYVHSLHKVHPNGLSVQTALGIAVRDQAQPKVKLHWDSAEKHSEKERLDIMDVLHEIKRQSNLQFSTFSPILNGNWSPTWEEELCSISVQLCSAADSLRSLADHFLDELKVSKTDITYSKLSQLYKLANALVATMDDEAAFVASANGRTDLANLANGLNLLAKFRVVKKGLSIDYPKNTWKKLNIPSIADRMNKSKQYGPIRSYFIKWLIAKEMRSAATSVHKPNPEQDTPILEQMRTHAIAIDVINEQLKHVGAWEGYATNIEAATESLHRGQQLLSAMSDFCKVTDSEHFLRLSISELIRSCNGEHPSKAIQAATRYASAFKAMREHVAKYDQVSGSSLISIFGTHKQFLSAISESASRIQANADHLRKWCTWLRSRDKALALGLQPFVAAIERKEVPIDSAPAIFEYNYCNWWLRDVFENEPILKHFSENEHSDTIHAFQQNEDEFAKFTVKYVASRLIANFPNETNRQLRHEVSVLKREMEKQRRHLPLRQLMTKCPTAISKLAPCLLMSPLSVAQYLPADYKQFDVVIFDEASQITVWDAIGAIARGKQVVVAGDKKQLPPTDYFSRSDDDDACNSDDEMEDLDSVLDEMVAATIPQIKLLWHYRSKKESLIAFSNNKYYFNELITFPSPTTHDGAVRLIPVKGVYDRGASRTNRAEADEVVAEIKKRLSGVMKTNDTESIGVITFNSEQQRLIENLLDSARLEDPSLEAHFSDKFAEPVFVKNLETVQGDERDVCMFSLAYGPDLANQISMNFGPLNRVGGERRLNVAITRARSELLVFSSIRPEDIDPTRTKSIGVHDLKLFLEYAETGMSAFARAVHNYRNDYESPFEEAVARMLKDKGWELRTQVGVSQFRIDLGVVHPDHLGMYLCGIECDGATYHRSATARDRDKIRESVLRALGWDLLRIWSTEFWLNSQESIDKLNSALEQKLYQSRNK